MWFIAVLSFTISMFMIKYMSAIYQKKKYFQGEDKKLNIIKFKE